jgi:hypothetical protein
MATPYSWARGGVGMTEAVGGRLSGGGRWRRTRGWGRQRREQTQMVTVGAEAVGGGGGWRWLMAGVEVGAAVEAEVGGGSLERMG